MMKVLPWAALATGAAYTATKNGVISFANAKLFGIADPKSAAIYSSSKQMIHASMGITLLYLVHESALNAVASAIKSIVDGEPLNMENITKESVITFVFASITIFCTMFTVSVVGGRYLANRVNQETVLIYRQIAGLELTHMAEFMILGI